MCARTRCRSCGKATWSGCGNHVEQALRGISHEERCRCRSAATAPPVQATATPHARGGFLSRLLGGG